LAVGFQPVAGVRFVDVFTTKLPVASWLSMAGLERTAAYGSFPSALLYSYPNRYKAFGLTRASPTMA
jgi:hypothetical protein